MEKDVALREWCIQVAEMVYRENKGAKTLDARIEDIIITIAKKFEKYIKEG